MPAAASPVEDSERQRIGEAFDLDEQQRAADIDILIRAVDFGDRVAGRAFERSGELAGARFFAGFPVACEVALLIDDKRVVRNRRARPAVVFGQIAPAVLRLAIEETRGAIVGYDRAGLVIIEQAAPAQKIGRATCTEKMW